jgi:ABC-2 type transport system ATP-binding protein
VLHGSISIETKDVTKKFKDFVAVDKLNLKVRRGEIFGFLGPNGAGKTTTIRMILGLMKPTEGSILVDNIDVQENGEEMKMNLGFLPERVGFYTNLTAKQTMEFYCDLKGKPRDEAKPLLARVGLADFIDKKVGTFSRGMVQLLGVAQSLIGSPSLLILDEPAGGLDPRWIKMVKDSMREAKQRGATVFFSSHILGEVEQICDRVAIIDHGKLVAEDSIDNLRKELEMKPRLWLQFAQISGDMVDFVKGIEGVANVHTVDNWLMVECDHEKRVLVMNALQAGGHQFLDIRTEEPSLEDVFLRYTRDTGEGGS